MGSLLHFVFSLSFLGKNGDIEPKVQFKNTDGPKRRGPVPKGITPLELKLSPTLYDINLDVKKVKFVVCWLDRGLSQGII